MKKPIFNKYVELICSDLNVPIEKLFIKDRTMKYVNARFILYSLCKSRPMSVLQIVEYMGDNGYKISRQSVEQGIRKINKSTDPDVINFMEKLTTKQINI